MMEKFEIGDAIDVGGVRMLLCSPEYPRMAAAAIEEQARPFLVAACRRHNNLPDDVRTEAGETLASFTLVAVFGEVEERFRVQVLSEGEIN